MNVFNIVSCCDRSRNIFDNYEKHETLSEEEQDTIVDIIANHICSKNVDIEVLCHLSGEIAAQICEIFPNEKIVNIFLYTKLNGLTFFIFRQHITKTHQVETHLENCTSDVMENEIYPICIKENLVKI